MKHKEQPLTMEEAVEKLVVITSEILSKYSREERVRKIRDCREFMASLKTDD